MGPAKSAIFLRAPNCQHERPFSSADYLCPGNCAIRPTPQAFNSDMRWDLTMKLSLEKKKILSGSMCPFLFCFAHKSRTMEQQPKCQEKSEIYYLQTGNTLS